MMDDDGDDDIILTRRLPHFCCCCFRCVGGRSGGGRVDADSRGDRGGRQAAGTAGDDILHGQIGGRPAQASAQRVRPQDRVRISAGMLAGVSVVMLLCVWSGV